jgi:FKBP-type peptidyl-prolyl cis-trans isomerase FklB
MNKRIMHNLLFPALLALLMLPVSLRLDAQVLTEGKDSLSYAVGLLMGQNIKQQGITDINPELLAKAIDDLLAERPTQLDLNSANNVLRAHMESMKAAKMEKNRAEGMAFLAANATREGVVVLASGLQYEIIMQGDGPRPTATDRVKVHYEGKLLDGTIFDSSVQRGEPIVLGLNQVISGWTEGLQLMPVGSKWRLFIPHDLAYGDRGAGAQIGPNATLVFEVELISIEP